MNDFYRKTLMPSAMMRLDSIQGFLEFAINYKNGRYGYLVCKLSDKENHESVYYILNRLESEGNISIDWQDYPSSNDEKMIKLNQISLTTNGHKLLEELTHKSKLGTYRKKIVDLFWVILTSIITTLVALKFNGI